jgi:hypothetical protein
MVDRRANIDQEIEDKKAQIMELKGERHAHCCTADLAH